MAFPLQRQVSARELYKIANEGRTWGQFLFGNGVSSIGDPNNRGFVADAALYSNPFSGTVTAVNDTARHLYNGHYGSALGSLGMGALSFIPGASSAVGAVGKGALKATTGAAARATGRGITNAVASVGRRTGSGLIDDAARGMNNFARQGATAVNKGQQAITSVGQKIVPQKYTQWEHGFRSPVQMQNPLSNGAGGFGLRSPVSGVQSPVTGQTFRNLYDGTTLRSGIDTAIANPASAATIFHNYGADPSGNFGPAMDAAAKTRLDRFMQPTTPNPFY